MSGDDRRMKDASEMVCEMLVVKKKGRKEEEEKEDGRILTISV